MYVPIAIFSHLLVGTLSDLHVDSFSPTLSTCTCQAIIFIDKLGFSQLDFSVFV